MLTTAEAKGIESIEGGIKRSQIRGCEPREMCEGRQGVVWRAGEMHKLRGFDDREERYKNLSFAMRRREARTEFSVDGANTTGEHTVRSTPLAATIQTGLRRQTKSSSKC